MVFGILGQILGVLFVIFGGFLIFFLPSSSDWTPKAFSLSGIVIGLLLLIFGGILIFF